MTDPQNSPAELAPETSQEGPGGPGALIAAAAPTTGPAAGMAAATTPGGSERPADVPEKFWDADGGTLRTEALLKSYLELERRLGSGDPAAQGDVAGGDAQGEAGTEPSDEPASEVAQSDIPAGPEDYDIAVESELVASDPEVNKRLHDAGFSQEQAQLVYRLAEEYLLPAVSDAYGEVVVQQELGRLQQAFGGAEGWDATAGQLQNWGKANLEPEVYDTLAASYDGVMAMHTMMQAREPRVVHADGPATAADEPALRRMMQDPRYWRDRDPGFIAEVTRGFERLFRG